MGIKVKGKYLVEGFENSGEEKIDNGSNFS